MSKNTWWHGDLPPDAVQTGHSIQRRLAHAWVLREVGERGFKGKRVMDFGPNGDCWVAVMASRGADVYWLDHHPDVPKMIAEYAANWKVKLTEVGWDGARDMDIITASAAIQHNQHTSRAVYAGLAKALAPKGALFVIDTICYGKSSWREQSRDDKKKPLWNHWNRCLRDHAVLWHLAGLVPSKVLFAGYDNSECKAWLLPEPLGNDECLLLAKLERAEDVIKERDAAEQWT